VGILRCLWTAHPFANSLHFETVLNPERFVRFIPSIHSFLDHAEFGGGLVDRFDAFGDDESAWIHAQIYARPFPQSYPQAKLGCDAKAQSPSCVRFNR
jgi:hypothetical protein